ncbi:MAG: STAS domain-containing protein [Thioalkalispiraceae bacterium]|jgi:anti-anti-sigma factor
MSQVIVKKSEEDDTITIDIEGTFDYRLHRDFRNAYRNQQANIKYVINLHKAEYMDSAALGMLLLLREHAGGDKASISINGCRPTVKKTFAIAQFDQLFTIC